MEASQPGQAEPSQAAGRRDQRGGEGRGGAGLGCHAAGNHRPDQGPGQGEALSPIQPSLEITQFTILNTVNIKQ